MAVATAAFETFLAVGNREDLTDMIYRISPTETPFFNMAGRPVQTLCSWPVPAEVAASILVDHIQRTSGRAARYLRKEGTVHFIQLDPPPGTDA